ncbi:A24 family peptidase C-terminal domain-containing protein [Methanobacterium sp.]|uniref:A24 family peptidase C-terminal domain-containing protein n=1 Tax=Methanobacterium sp. TaxID=2164 RepID=UPI003C746357
MVFNIPLICSFIAIIACLYASYTDLKSGIIQNKLTFSLIGLGIILNAVYAFTTGNIWFIVLCVVFTAVIFALGYIFWKLGAWAGGDVKLFTALTALLPFYPLTLNYNIWGVAFPIVSLYGFPFTLIINSLLSILPFLLIYVLFIAIRRKPYLVDELLAPIKEYRKNIVISFFVISSIIITLFIRITFHIVSPYELILISLILVPLLTFIILKLPIIPRYAIVVLAFLFVILGNFSLSLNTATIVTNVEWIIGGVLLVFISMIIIGIVKSLLTSVNKKALQDDYEIDNLKEGMIPAYNMYERADEVYVDNTGFFDKIRKSLKNGDPTSFMAPKGKLLISSMAAGLTEDDITLLKKLHGENKIDSKIKIKRGVPFAPSILIGLLISLFIGDLAVILQNILYVIIY